MNIEVYNLNSRATKFLINFSYTLSSNLISMIISTIVTLIVPRLIGVEEYGFWQLYLFYSAYVGFFHFGWNDGIYLRYGGNDYDELDKRLFFSQFYMLFLLQLILSLILFFISNIFVMDQDKLFILKVIACNMFLSNLRGMLLFILQGTNRIREYATITMIDRILYLSVMVILLFAGFRQYNILILTDIMGKAISLLYAIYCCRDIVLRNVSTFYVSFKESFENINVGIKLMFANIASTLIIGVVRFGIEKSWNVSTFGKVSLTLSISNFLMVFINTVGIVMFPILRRTEDKKLSSIYNTMRDFLMIVLLGMLIVYYPFKLALSAWLPNYVESLKYMAILFPMCVYEGKTSLLINTYLKTLRKEKIILVVNLVTLSISIISTVITTYFIRNLDLTVMSIVLLLIIRCVIAEIYLANILGISVYKDIIIELIMTTVFIISSWYINSWITTVIYGIVYIVYLIVKHGDIKKMIKNIKELIHV